MLKQRLVDDQIHALKNHDQARLSVLRYILAQIKNKEIEKRPASPAGGSDLKDEETTMGLRKIVKELNESIEAAKSGKREDLVLENQKQLSLVSTYLPKEISDEELKKEIEKIISENQDLYRKNPKVLIGISVGKLKSKADPARIVRLVQTVSKS